MRKYIAYGKRTIKKLLSYQNNDYESYLKLSISKFENFPELRVCVAGAGKFAQVHLKVLSDLPNVRIVGVSNRGNSDISHLKTEFGVEKTFPDYIRMLDQCSPDCVFVVVSHFETVKVASECLQRQIACLIEKPAGMTAEETKYLAGLANNNMCLNMVALNRRFISTIHEALISVLQNGELIGIVINAPEAIRRIRNNGRHDERLYLNWLIANNIHAIDLLRCLGGEIADMKTMKNCRQERNGDSFTAIMRFENNCLGTYISHWNSAGTWSLSLYGDDIKAEVSLGKYSGMILKENKTIPLNLDPIDLHYKVGIFAQDTAFISAVSNNEKLTYPASDLNDSVKTMQLIESILEIKNDSK